jgi:hypothetical protein
MLVHASIGETRSSWGLRPLSPLGQALRGRNPSRDARLLMLAIGARARARTLLRSPLDRIRYRPRHRQAPLMRLLAARLLSLLTPHTPWHVDGKDGTTALVWRGRAMRGQRLDPSDPAAAEALSGIDWRYFDEP